MVTTAEQQTPIYFPNAAPNNFFLVLSQTHGYELLRNNEFSQVLNLWDCGGQEAYMESYFESQVLCGLPLVTHAVCVGPWNNQRGERAR
jgi:hypothetical protein